MSPRFPTNGWEQEEFHWDAEGLTSIYLLDANMVDIFEDILDRTGLSLFDEIEKQPGQTFMFSTGVGVELMNRPGGFDPKYFKDHLINTSGSSQDRENRFVVEVKGELRVAYGNMTSIEDWDQVLLCQNHERLKLVTNDVNLTKNAIRVAGEGRTRTIYSLLDDLMTQDPSSTSLVKIFDYVNTRKVLKIKSGTMLPWQKPPKHDSVS